MRSLHRKPKHPERGIQKAIIKMLQIRGWYVRVTHGSIYQSGLPDLFATHAEHGPRWIEVKLPRMIGSHFTSAQRDVFPKLTKNGSGVWILTAATVAEYEKLFRPCNWWVYLVR